MTNSQELLDSFTEFCNLHPGLRFWQALRSWSGADKILFDNGGNQVDTFYWNDANDCNLNTEEVED